MYCGSINLSKLQSHEILNLLLSSDELGLQHLVITYIQDTLFENHDFIIKNIIEITESTYQKKSLDKLWDFCLQHICDKPDRLFKSTKFLTFNPFILEIILKRDDFLVSKEIIIWENLLKWACGQNPIIQQDINKWNKNDFTVMERRLSRFISFIRFYHMSSEDFLLKIYPFKELLPNDLIKNIFEYHMVPNNRKNIDILPLRKNGSIIITSKHFAIFASWIKKQNYSYYNDRIIPYGFKLIYRASRDGNTAATFHEKCDNKGATIVIVKIENSEKIIGGYNPLDWKAEIGHSGYSKSTKESFIFSFTDRDNFQTAKLSYPNNYHHAIMSMPNNGPIFGYFDILSRNNNNWENRNCTNPRAYSIIGIPQTFRVNDYEVFQVIE